MLLVHINKHLLAVEGRRTVVAFIVYQTACIIVIGIDHLHLEHRPNLPRIRPCRAAALWAGGYILSVDFALCMGTVGAKPPQLRLSSSQVNLVNR